MNRRCGKGRISPCAHCTRVPDPARCDNKACVPWRSWFISRWENMRQGFGTLQQARQQAEQEELRRFFDELENGSC